MVCWSKAPVGTPGQRTALTVIVDGASFPISFPVAQRRMQDVVLGLVPTRIEGGPEQRIPEYTKLSQHASMAELMPDIGIDSRELQLSGHF